MIKELDTIVLTSDVPELRLRAGDIGTVVMVHAGGTGYEVEFIALDGETLAVTTLDADRVRTINRREIPHARPVAA